MSAPIVTRDDVWQLLDSPGEDPVLYLNDEGGELEVDHWAAAYIDDSKVLVHRHKVVDAIGDAPDADAVDHYPTLLQPTVEEVAAALV
ncbi:hypothetical protein [Streptomyces sp. NPDC056672]|uniref:hypothetical protein n=1 Tax=Streptomyces sp. NPDC056672 TaxID=3345906 RepID=UPI00369AC704